MPPVGPPDVSPVLKEIDPLDPWPPFDCPVLNATEPLEPFLYPAGALAIT